MPIDDKLLNKLLSKRHIDPEKGCWLWTGSLRRDGYGQTDYQGKKQSVHRLSAKFYFDADLSLGRKLCVLHKCDVRHCFNPEHLFLGTYKDNNIDTVSKRRHISGSTINVRKGTNHPVSKLTENDVRDIRKRASAGETTR